MNEPQNLGLIIAIVGSAVAIVGVMITLMHWVRLESNDTRKEQKEDRKDLIQISRSMELEMRDFHHKLLEIERGRK